MELTSLFREKAPSERRSLTVFRADMIARDEASWQELFSGSDTLKAITYSSGLDLILELSGMFRDIEITFGSAGILSREHAALEQASHLAQSMTSIAIASPERCRTLSSSTGNVKAFMPRSSIDEQAGQRTLARPTFASEPLSA
jgi:hypothetical protein